MKKLLSFFIVFLLTACSMADRSTKITSQVQGLIYNDIASRYSPRLTQVFLEDFSDGSQALRYMTELFGKNSSGVEYSIYVVSSKNADEHLSLLNKFIDWNKKAKDRGDQFEKKIGSAKTVNGYIQYTFHSSNEYKNLLVTCFSLSEDSMCTDATTFDLSSVNYIISDITKLKNRSLKQLDTSIYQ